VTWDTESKGQVVRTLGFELDHFEAGQLFQTVRVVTEGHFIGDHCVFKLHDKKQVAMYDNIFGLDIAQEEYTTYTSPLVDNSYRKLAFL